MASAARPNIGTPASLNSKRTYETGSVIAETDTDSTPEVSEAEDSNVSASPSIA
jgi:hypothetical protein